MNINIQHKVMEKVLCDTCSLFTMTKPRNLTVWDMGHGRGLCHTVTAAAAPCRRLLCQQHWVWLGKLGTSRQRRVPPAPLRLALTGGARRRPETTDATMTADGSGDTSQDRKVFARHAEPVPTARAARDQIRESSRAAGRGIFHIGGIPRGGRRCRNPSSRFIKTQKREKE